MSLASVVRVSQRLYPQSLRYLQKNLVEQEKILLVNSKVAKIFKLSLHASKLQRQEI